MVNTTRDSGFGDSIAEDTSASSASAKHLGAHSEHGLDVGQADSNATDIVPTTKNFPSEKSKLKSVEEDIDVIHPVDPSGIKYADFFFVFFLFCFYQFKNDILSFFCLLLIMLLV